MYSIFGTHLIEGKDQSEMCSWSRRNSSVRRWLHAFPKCERVSNLVDAAGTSWKTSSTGRKRRSRSIRCENFGPLSTLRVAKDSITWSRRENRKKPDLTYSRHTLSNRLFSFAKRRPVANGENTERDGCSSIRGSDWVGNDVPVTEYSTGN